MEQVSLRPLFHRKQDCIAIYFLNTKELQEVVQTIINATWSRTYKCWYVPCTRHHYENIKVAFVNMAMLEVSALRLFLEQRKKLVPVENVQISVVSKISTKQLNAENSGAMEQMQRMLVLKGYSPNTMRVYCYEFKHLLGLLGDRSVNSLEKTHVLSYLLWLIKNQGYSEQHVHSAVNAIKFYFEKVKKYPPEFYDLPRPKKPLKLPAVLSLQEMTRLIQQLVNIKHRTMIMTGYAAGLRVSEIINLKTKDIDSERMMIHIHGAKGKKDRMVPLSKKLLLQLREYYIKYKPKEFLFEGQLGGQYSSRSAQQVIKEAKVKAGITKSGSMHTLRHSYATHLIESGTDIRYIQALLGHNNITTTMRYTHVSKKFLSKIESPLDKLDW